MAGLAACGESTTGPLTECETTANPTPTGTLTPSAGGYTFTATDGWKIIVDENAITFAGPLHPDKVELWGVAAGTNELVGNHESHNGKHIKDRPGGTRSILLPSGALMTAVSDGVFEPLQTVSIYEGGQSHTIDPRTMKLTHSCEGSVSTTAAREAAEADGETSSLKYNAHGGTLFVNEYTQDASASGAPLGKVHNERLLSETGGPANPNVVNDFFDDPRLGHT